MAVLREGLDNIDTCPYEHSHKQEWEIPFNPQKADLPECEYTPQEKKGHPLVCHLLGSECKSPLRILRTAVVHFPLLGDFQGQVYTCLAQFKVIRDIDLGIHNNDYQLLLQACGVTFETMFKQTLDASKPSGDGSTLDTPFRVSHLEAALLSEYDTVIERYDKKVRDYALHVCICCERLFRCKQCTKLGFDDFQDKLVWLGIKAFALMSNPDLDEEQRVFLCSHCKPKIKGNDMPARCVLNGLETVPLPNELKGLDSFSLQLIQLAKTFQTVIRLKTYSHKVPTYNALKACKGNMFVLPLPLTNTVEKLELSECGLPKPELYVKVDGVPTNKKILWRKFIDIKEIQAALTKLKEMNWLYTDVQPDKVEKSTDDLVIEVANSATSEMIEKVSNKPEYLAGLQAFTVRSMDKHVPIGTGLLC